MKLQELIGLAKAAASNAPTFTFGEETVTNEVVNETLRRELAEMSKDYNTFSRNKYDIYQLIVESVDETVPAELENLYDRFAEVRQYGINDRPTYRVKLSGRAANRRARQFVTQVSSAGLYEVFKLGGEKEFDVKMKAVGGAAQIAFEDFLTGRVDWNELVQIVALGMADRVSEDIAATFAKLPDQIPAIKHAASGFDTAAFEHILDKVKLYGQPVIYCTEAFARQMVLPGDMNLALVPDSVKETLFNGGYYGSYRGKYSIVLLPNEYKTADAADGSKYLDDGIAYILPSQDAKPVKVALQGATQVKDVASNSDWSHEMHTYKRYGVSLIASGCVGVYVNNDIATVAKPEYTALNEPNKF